MTRRVLTVSALLIALGCASTVPPATLPLRSSFPYDPAVVLQRPIRTIVIDAGHGGHDPGTAHNGLKEKYLTLDIVRRLRPYLQHAGLKVLMTRDADRFIPLSRRAGIANRADADLFVSVHINANRSRRVSGIEVYYPRVSVIAPSSTWPPSVSSSEIGLATATVRQVLWDMVLSRTRANSRQLASTICSSMQDGLRAPCRKVHPARFVVLREAQMPAVLVEVGYVSNREEAQRLGRASYRQGIAKAIASGIVAYIRQQGAQHI